MRLLLLFMALLLAPVASAVAGQAGRATESAEPDTPAYYFLLARHLESIGRVDEALKAHNRAIALDPGSAELRAELAGFYARQDNAVEAVAHAEAAIARDASNPEANRILGTVYAAFAERRLPLRKGDDPATYPDRAIAALERARGDGADPGLDLVLGRLYVQTKNFAKAVPVLSRVVESQPSLVDAAILLSTAQEGAGAPEQAIATLQKALAENGDSFRAQIRLAEIYEADEQWNEAANALARAQTLNPRAPMIARRRAVALLSAGRASEARDLLQATIASGRSDAKDPVLLYLLAESQRVVKDLDAAQATAQALIAANPEDVRGLHVLSLILQDKGDIKGAERTLRDLIARDPMDANALNSLGYMLAEQSESHGNRNDRLDEAVTLLQRALKIEPGNPSYLDSLGWAYFQQGRLDLADAPLSEAADKLKDNSVVQDHLGDLRFKQRRFADAAVAWERALGGDGQSIDKAKIESKIREARGRM
jgi:tetratricopeptide (TPR) repeat protein